MKPIRNRNYILACDSGFVMVGNMFGEVHTYGAEWMLVNDCMGAVERKGGVYLEVLIPRPRSHIMAIEDYDSMPIQPMELYDRHVIPWEIWCFKYMAGHIFYRLSVYVAFFRGVWYRYRDSQVLYREDRRLNPWAEEGRIPINTMMR